MTDFFRGWRRKAGVVTLVMALAFAVGWVRSVRLTDFIGINSKASYCFVSYDGILEIQTLAPMPHRSATAPRLIHGDADSSTTRVTLAVPRAPTTMWFFWGCTRLDYYYQGFAVRVNGFDVGWQNWDVDWRGSIPGIESISANDGSRQSFTIMVRYWSIVLPLTVLTSYLLLSKPRSLKKSETFPPPEPDHA